MVAVGKSLHAPHNQHKTERIAPKRFVYAIYGPYALCEVWRSRAEGYYGALYLALILRQFSIGLQRSSLLTASRLCLDLLHRPLICPRAIYLPYCLILKFIPLRRMLNTHLANQRFISYQDLLEREIDAQHAE